MQLDAATDKCQTLRGGGGWFVAEVGEGLGVAGGNVLVEFIGSGQVGHAQLGGSPALAGVGDCLVTHIVVKIPVGLAETGSREEMVAFRGLGGGEDHAAQRATRAAGFQGHERDTVVFEAVPIGQALDFVLWNAEVFSKKIARHPKRREAVLGRDDEAIDLAAAGELVERRVEIVGDGDGLPALGDEGNKGFHGEGEGFTYEGSGAGQKRVGFG